MPISRAREVYARARAPARPRGRRRRHAHRLADHRPRSRSTTPSRCSPISSRTLRADGHAIDHVDLGGGLGIPYRVDNEPPPLPGRLRRDRRPPHRATSTARSIFEPGRLIVGNAGVLATSVIYVKHGDAKNFVIVDAAMNDLIRPTLYDAHHEILARRRAGARRAAPARRRGRPGVRERRLSRPRPRHRRTRSRATCWR